MSAPFTPEFRLTKPNGENNLPAIRAYAAKLEAKLVTTATEQIGGATITYMRHCHSAEEAYGLAIDAARTERERNQDYQRRNEAARLQRLCHERDAKRIAATMTAEQIQFQIMRRSFGSFALRPETREELEVYHEAQRLQEAGVALTVHAAE